jgi:hypothetical protein
MPLSVCNAAKKGRVAIKASLRNKGAECASKEGIRLGCNMTVQQ